MIKRIRAGAGDRLGQFTAVIPGTVLGATAVALGLVLAAAPAARAAKINADAGTSGASFLKLGAGARAGAMADANTALADDVYALYYNPAGLSQLPGPQIAGAHTALFGGMSYEVFQFAYPFAHMKEEGFSRHVLGFGVYYLAVDDLERRVSDTTDGLGKFGASDASYAASYAFALDRRLSLGTSVKLISQDLDTYHASAFGADAGALYRLNPEGDRPMAVAATVRNLGSRPGFAKGDKDPLPLAFTGAVSGHVIKDRLKLDVEMTKYRDQDAFVAFGGEFVQPFQEHMSAAVRAGFTSARRDGEGLNGLTLGAGVGFQKASFDFAWLPFGTLGNSFRYSLLVKF